jgi:hypothetical protein
LLEQQFQLKTHGNLSLFEQENMTAEDRAWWMKRIEKDIKERNEKEKEAMSKVRTPSKPRRR